MIAQNGTELPFDIKDTGTLFYDPDHLDVDDFLEDFKAAIKDCLENSDRTDSHVLETLSGRGTLYEIIRRDETLRRLDAVLVECNYNQSMFEGVIKKIKRNREGLENWTIAATPFRLCSTELLVTNRYVNEDSSFYAIAELYWGALSTLNSQLELWAHTNFKDSFEKNTIENEEFRTNIFKTFKYNIETVRAKIEQKQY